VSPHDYRHLITRWKELARRAEVPLRPFAEADGERLYHLETPGAATAEPLYLSAGIHGDEVGGTEGLLAWAQSRAKDLRQLPLLIFPCLNPWGLRNNLRLDATGADLNRSFHTSSPVVKGVKTVVGARRFAATVHLHEDYDAEGVYLYELSRKKKWGESLLDAARKWIAPDSRQRIERRLANGGVVRRRVTPKTFAKVGHPEQIWLFFAHTDHTLTIETPSEFGLERRAAAQSAILEEVARRLF
jgi:hypothetical protein